ncbi:MAG: hypothetical protein OXR82_18795 [Gammaproteobacteria bacterium]|nr:hypothetical protein [Gammaproteobacteria bacterium]
MTGPIRSGRAVLRRGAPYLLAFAGLAWAVSCGDEPTTPPPNLPPATEGTIPAQSLKPWDTVTLNAAQFFSDPEGHQLTFTTASSDTTVASVSVMDSTLTIYAEGPGVATVSLTAHDPRGLAANHIIDVTVDPYSDRQILILFHEATGGPNWYGRLGWLSDAPLEDWFGVEVDDDGNVIELELYRNNLIGTVPPELGGLTSLTRLQLASNHLSGPIPAELAELSNLSFLGFFNNDLEGTVPSELGGLTNLTHLELDRNRLTGPIPRSFLELDGLRRFYFAQSSGLCVPGSPEFTAWMSAMKGEARGPFCNQSDLRVLESLYLASGGQEWTNATGWPEGAAASQRYGVGTDALGRVTALDLTANGLAGRLPENLGRLTLLTELRVADNALGGRLPQSLPALPLRWFDYAETELCVPPDAHFKGWLDGIEWHQGTRIDCAPPSDRDVLVALYDATGGPDWTERGNWLTDAELGEWYGVETDSSGRVTALRLQNNGLEGPLPPELGHLSALRDLVLWNNDLSGPIPPELGNLPNLTSLVVVNSNLSGTIPPELGNLAELSVLLLASSELTGPIPAELGKLVNLTSLTLDDNALEGPIPPELGNLAALESLSLALNYLTGPIPPELGSLSSLRQLGLGGNELTGSIPPELAMLEELQVLVLWDNDLTGPVPPELGSLGNLLYATLAENELTGPIPPELGSLARIDYLTLADNNLTGPIPPEFGRLIGAIDLDLRGNALTGQIPAELGRLPRLVRLSLGRNDLSGPISPRMGGMSHLRELDVTDNAGLSGALPEELTELNLDMLATGGTDLCAPSGEAFQQWLAAVPKRRLIPCAEGEPASAYLTQAVQSRSYRVPLVAGRPALLRVFVTAARPGGANMPAVRARFLLDGVETHVAEIASSPVPIPTEVDEGDLAASANAEIPGEVIQPGLEMVIEIDPEGVLDPALGVARRIPADGGRAVDVRAMPPLDLTLVPFLQEQTPDSSILALTTGMATDPGGHELLHDTRTLLPVGELEVTAHEPVLISSNNAYDLFRETIAIWAVEGGMGHYMGMIAGRTTVARGIAGVPGRVSFSVPDSRIIAHELGHNMYLHHAPCGGAGGPDPSFPEPDGSIGAWGYDFRRGRLVAPARHDLMSYCEPPWVSDYYFTNALRFRIRDEAPRVTQAAAGSGRSLLLWGGVDPEGKPFLEPAFVLEAPANVPRAGSEYRITGRDARDRELFSLGFDMPVPADGDGRAAFAIMLPVRDGWAEDLAGITLAGPGGSDTLNRESARPMAILRNPRTGQVRGILRRTAPVAQAAMDGTGSVSGSGLEVLLSPGLPGAAAWRR